MGIVDKIFANYCISFFLILAGHLIVGNQDISVGSLVLANIFLTVALTIMRW